MKLYDIFNIVESAIAIENACECVLRQAYAKGEIIDHVSDI